MSNKPRIFLSSTYYDLKYLRELLEQFITEDLDFQPVLHDRGDVTYQITRSLEEDCYEQISTCDMLINIVGQRFGTESKINRYSITQTELYRAIDEGMYVYVFVELAVLNELSFFRKNRDIENLNTDSDKRVLEFLDDLQTKHPNIPTFAFNRGKEITGLLKKQISGLFKSLLDEKKRRNQKVSPEKPRECDSKLKVRSVRPRWSPNLKDIRDNIVKKNLDYDGVWKTEFRKQSGYGFSCMLDIEFEETESISEYSISMQKFEEFGGIDLYYFEGEKPMLLQRLFDGKYETDTIVRRQGKLESPIQTKKFRIGFTGDTSNTAWYAIERFEFK